MRRTSQSHSGLLALGNEFKDSRGAHSAANAHGDHAVSPVAALEFAEDAGGQLRARATQWMSERDRAAVDVNFLRIQTQCLDHSERLGCEGFVQFNYVDVLEC